MRKKSKKDQAEILLSKSDLDEMDEDKKRSRGGMFIGADCAGVECITSWFIISAALVKRSAAQFERGFMEGYCL